MQHQTDQVDEEKLVPTAEVYRYFEKTLQLTPRTIQWYATEGLIPKPVRQGRDAFYDPEGSQIYHLVHIICELQRRFGLRLWKIKEILEKYKGQHLGKLRLLLEQAEESYPALVPDEYGRPYLNDHNELVRTVLLSKLREGAPADQLSLLEIEREADQYEQSTPAASKKETSAQETGEVPF